MAGVTVSWNSPLPPVDDAVSPSPADSADAAGVREVDKVNGEEDADVGMSWSPAELALIIVELCEVVDVKASDDRGDGVEEVDDTGWMESWW